MHYVLFFVLFFSNGTVLNDGNVYKTESECQVAAAKVPVMVEDYNTNEEPKVVGYAYGCQPLKAIGTEI